MCSLFRKIALVVSICLPLLGTLGGAHSQAGPPAVPGLSAAAAFTQVGVLYAKTLQATGMIMVRYDDGGIAFGTCWVVDRDKRLVVTNHHIVGDRSEAEVYFPIFRNGQLVTLFSEYASFSKRPGKDMIKGTVLARDQKRDLALVQLERLPDFIGALTLSPSSAKVNDRVLSIGNSSLVAKPSQKPLLWKMRTGFVAQKSFQVMIFQRPCLHTMESSLLTLGYRADSCDSGGPVVNQKGELVGVTALKAEPGAMAIDVSEVRSFLQKTMPSGPLPLPKSRNLTGTWTQAWLNGASGQHFASLTILPDGTVLYESGACSHEGTYSLSNDRLTITLPGLGRPMSGAIYWFNDDHFQLTCDRVLYTITRR